MFNQIEIDETANKVEQNVSAEKKKKIYEWMDSSDEDLRFSKLFIS